MPPCAWSLRRQSFWFEAGSPSQTTRRLLPGNLKIDGWTHTQVPHYLGPRRMIIRVWLAGLLSHGISRKKKGAMERSRCLLPGLSMWVQLPISKATVTPAQSPGLTSLPSASLGPRAPSGYLEEPAHSVFSPTSVSSWEHAGILFFFICPGKSPWVLLESCSSL